MKVMSKVIEVVTPPKIIDVKTINAQVEAWEAKVNELDGEYEERISDNMKMAILMAMCPAAIQDTVFQQMVEGATYKQMKDKMVMLVNNRMAMNNGGAVPMEIGEANDGGGQWDDGECGVCGHGLEYGVEAVFGNKQCFHCGLYGHFARECPNKGKGKGMRKSKGE